METVDAAGRRSKTYSSAPALQRALRNTYNCTASRWTVRRDMHAMGFKARVRPKVPTRRPDEVFRKRQFCHRHFKKTPMNMIVHSDEAWLSCNENTGRVQYVRPGELPHPMERKARWNTPSAMVHAAVGVGYKSELQIFPSKMKDAEGEQRVFRLDAKGYIRRCLSPIAPYLVKSNKILLQDGARSHVAKASRCYLARKGIKWLEDYPAYSADLNMIEPVWKDLHAAVGAMRPTTQQELIKCAKAAWRGMPQRQIDAHVLHWHGAMSCVMTLKK